MGKKQQISKDEPITLDELEIRFLSQEKINRNRGIRVADKAWVENLGAIKMSIQSRFERKLSVLVILIITLMLFIGVIFPSRYEYTSESVKLFLAATSGFFAARATRTELMR